MKKTLTKPQVLNLIRAQCKKLGSQRAYAEICGVSPIFVSDVLAGKRSPTEPLLAPINIKRQTVYVMEGK